MMGGTIPRARRSPRGSIPCRGPLMIQRLGFLGMRTDSRSAFEATVALYREALGVEPFLAEPDAVWFRARDGSQIHVYGPGDTDHDFFRAGPAVGLVREDF